MNGLKSGIIETLQTDPSMYTLSDWHSRFQQQAQWTSQLRRYLYTRVNIQQSGKILDIGCGTGVLEAELHQFTPAAITAVDIDHQSISFAARFSSAGWTCADAACLPYPSYTFDIALCHYLLLWLKAPVAALSEMKRVTRPGGHILLLAEPDYAHRIDYPTELSEPGALQRNSLLQQGANPDIGSTIGSLLSQAGVEVMETGLSGGSWQPAIENDDTNLEWQMLIEDLQLLTDKSTLAVWKKKDILARLSGTRILFIPVFYAIGRVP